MNASEYQRLLELLTQYLSHLNAQGALNRALRARDLTPDRVMASDVAGLVPEILSRAGLFLDPDVLAALTRRLASFNGQSRSVTRTVPIARETDISDARTVARDLCAEAGARSLTIQKVATMVSELARNIVSYTPGGKVVLSLTGDPPRFTVRAIDRGAGITNLEDILSGRYRSKTGLGKGMSGVKKLADRFDIQTGSSGTTVEAEVNL